VIEGKASDAPLSADDPRPLPHCAYPRASDVAQHGVQALPAALPLVDFTRAGPHRSRRYAAIPAADLRPAQVLQLADVVGTSFARREPQCRHLQPPKYPPAGLMEARHADPLGSERFGPWTRERLLYWFIRLLVLTDPAQPKSVLRVRQETLAQSLAIVDQTGRVIGGAVNETMPPLEASPEFRQDDPFLTATLSFVSPVLTMLSTQDAEGLTALCARYPAFREAYAQGKVGHHFMVARSDGLPRTDAFELVAASCARYQALGHAYMLIEATNQWTGAACEVLGGVRVHFAPFQGRYAVQRSAEPLEDVVTSPNGWLSDKDSGSMFYVIRLV
jgi:hypothetical protein